MKPRPFAPEAFGDDPRYVRDRTDSRVWHRCQTRTLYADTDRSQVVYHANYLRYFELGRVTLMRDAAYPYREVEESGFVYPIIEVGLTYHAPLHYDDSMWIHTRPGTLERVRLQFDYVVTHGESGVLVCKGFTRHCATNGAGVPVGVDEKTRQLWRNFPG
jgi:acyl-CoA thioester hydrolase